VETLSSIFAENTEQVLTESRTMRAGHVYAIQFCSGVLKVGRTSQPNARIAEHEKAARAHGRFIYDTIVSPPHTNYVANERALIAFCAERWELAAGREYFAAADMEAVVRFTDTLAFTPLAQGQITAAAAQAMQERARRARLLDLAEPFYDQILRAAEFPAAPAQLSIAGGAV
jgi:hypothetical protein